MNCWAGANYCAPMRSDKYRISACRSDLSLRSARLVNNDVRGKRRRMNLGSTGHVAHTSHPTIAVSSHRHCKIKAVSASLGSSRLSLEDHVSTSLCPAANVKIGRTHAESKSIRAYDHSPLLGVCVDLVIEKVAHCDSTNDHWRFDYAIRERVSRHALRDF